MRERRLAAILSAFVIQGLACPAADAGGDVLKGRTVYETNCAACHGEGGRGDGPVAAALQPPPVSLGSRQTKSRSDSELLLIIRNGRGSMPGWKAQLDEDELRDLLAYLRTLRE